MRSDQARTLRQILDIVIQRLWTAVEASSKISPFWGSFTVESSPAAALSALEMTNGESLSIGLSLSEL